MPLVSSLPRTGNARSPVVIVVPRYTATLKDDERISLMHLHHFLGEFDTYFVSPQSLAIENPELPILRFNDRFFSGLPGYNRLMLSEAFYRTFEAWEYILIYQLDCLVFSDQLMQWCARGYDYIGSPWLNSPQEPEKGFSRVGNGGFSLRRVPAFLKVLENSGNLKQVIDNALRLGKQKNSPLQRSLWWWLLKLYQQPVRFKHNEDGFWSDFADKHDPEYLRPPIDVALSFGFECAPEYCFELNNSQLPFGCHAWARYNRSFWEPYLLTS